MSGLISGGAAAAARSRSLDTAADRAARSPGCLAADSRSTDVLYRLTKLQYPALAGADVDVVPWWARAVHSTTATAATATTRRATGPRPIDGPAWLARSGGSPISGI